MEDRALELWNAWRLRRDGEAFAALVRPDLGRAISFARTQGCGTEDAEDAVQDALAVLAAERGGEPARVGVRAWFFRAVRDRARTRARSGWRRRSRERAAARPEAAAESADRLAVREQVEKALASLSEEDREAVRLRHLQDLDYREMAYVLGVSEGACRVRVHRALERLQASLGPGAVAMLAAFPFPVPGNATALLQGATATAAKGAGGAAATGGAVAMGTATKTAAAAGALVAAAMLGAVGATVLRPADAPIPPATTAIETASPTRPKSEVAPPATVAESARAVLSSEPAPKPPAIVDATPEEWEFVKSALAKERARREAASFRDEDGGLEILDRVLKSGGDYSGSLWDWAAVRGRVRTGDGERRAFASSGGPESTAVNLSDVAGKDAVIELGPGRFRLDNGSKGGRPALDLRASVRSIEIRGAGKDATVLDAGDAHTFLMVGETKLENLVVRDLTFDGGTGTVGLLDIRGSASVIVENVRFVNIHDRGFAAPVGVMGSMFLGMRGCDWIGSGREFGVGLRGGALALLQECRFQGLQCVVLGDGDIPSGSTVHLKDCTFDGVPATDSRAARNLGKQPALAIRARGGHVSFGPPDMKDEDRRAKWGAGYLAEVEGVTFGPSRPPCTLGHLLAVLDAAPVPSGEVVTRVELAGSGPEGPARFGVSTMDPRDGKARHYFCRADGSGWETMPERMGKPWVPPPEEIEGALPLAQVLRQSGLGADTAATAAAFGRPMKRNVESIPTLQVRAPDPWPSLSLNARTGEDWMKRR